MVSLHSPINSLQLVHSPQSHVCLSGAHSARDHSLSAVATASTDVPSAGAQGGSSSLLQRFLQLSAFLQVCPICFLFLQQRPRLGGAAGSQSVTQRDPQGVDAHQQLREWQF